MNRGLIIVTIYLFTILFGAILFAIFYNYFFSKLPLPYSDLFLITGVITTICSLPFFIVYLFLFTNKKCTHQHFINETFFFIGICLLIVYILLLLTSPIKFISFFLEEKVYIILIVSHFLSSFSILIFLKFKKDQVVQN